MFWPLLLGPAIPPKYPHYRIPIKEITRFRVSVHSAPDTVCGNSSAGEKQLRRPPEAHLDWGMKTPGGQFRFNSIVRMCRSIL